MVAHVPGDDSTPASEPDMPPDHWFRHLPENIADAVVWVRDGVVVWASPALASTIGWPPDTWLGSSYTTFTHPEDRDKVTSTWERLDGDGSALHRFRMRSPDGRYHWVEGHAHRYVDGDGHRDGVIETMRPIDSIVKAEQELERRAKLDGVFLLQFLEELFIDWWGLEGTLGDLQCLEHRSLELAELADLSVGEHQGLDHDALAQLFGPGLDHDNRLFTSCDHQVERRIAELFVGGIDDIDPLDQAYPHAGDRVVEGNVGEIECRGGTGDRENVWIVFVIR